MSRISKGAMLLYGVTDRSWTGPQSLYEQVRAALQGGITCLQLREKNLAHQEFLTHALRIKELCHSYKVPLIINDDVSMAIESGADGVHIGQQDMDILRARELLGSEMILGVSAHTVDEALWAERHGADYLGVGAAFSTSTKSDASAISHKVLKSICSAVSIPVCAIGGISKDNLMELKGTGLDGVALVSAIFASKDIYSECQQLRALSSKMIRK